MKRKIHFLILPAVVFLLCSCASSKKFVYLQDMEPGHGYPCDIRYEAVVHTDDRLDITVSSKNPELAIPFNVRGGSFRVDAGGSVTENTASAPRGLPRGCGRATSTSPSWASSMSRG